MLFTAYVGSNKKYQMDLLFHLKNPSLYRIAVRRERKRRPARIARIRIHKGIDPASGGSRAST